MNYNKYCIISFIFQFLTWFFLTSINAEAQWYLLGLKDQNVNCIIIDDSKRIIAGTDYGLFIWDSMKWLEITLPDNLTNVPIKDIKMQQKNEKFVVAIGKGLRYDYEGIYLGKGIVESPYYEVSLIAYFEKPQSVEICGDTVYAGSGNKIVMSIAETNGLYYDLIPLKTPEYCFGIESPICATLYFMSGFGILYAGGYDLNSPSNIGSLLWEQDDTMVIHNKLNVTSIVEGIEVDEDEKLFLCGTRDSTIYIFTSLSSVVLAENQSPNNEEIRDMFLQFGSDEEVLYVAVQSGIYFFKDNIWIELGNLPEIPNCITAKFDTINNEENIFFVGTQKGVYTTDSSITPIINSPLKESYRLNPNAFIIRKGPRNTVSIPYTIKKAGNITIYIIDCTGRIIRTLIDEYVYPGNYDFLWNGRNEQGQRIGSGVFIVQISVERKKFYQKIALTN